MGRSTAGSRPPGNWYSVLSTVTDDIDIDTSLTGHGESLLSLLPDAVAVDDKLRTEATSRPLPGDAMAIDAHNRQSMPESYNRTI